MSNEITAFDRSLLALIAYANLRSGMNQGDFVKACEAANIPEALALYAYRRFEVVKSSLELGIGNISGYSGVVFKSTGQDGMAAGQLIFANRGTETGTPWQVIMDLLVADIAQIGSGKPPSFQMSSMLDFLEAVKGLPDCTGKTFDVVGHSPGGALSVALGLVKGNLVSRVDTVNGPDVPEMSVLMEAANLWVLPEVKVPSNQVHQWISDIGFNGIAGFPFQLMPYGDYRTVYAPDHFVGPHTMTQLLMQAFASLSSTVFSPETAAGRAAFAGLANALERNHGAELDEAVNALWRIAFGSEPPTVPPPESTDINTWEHRLSALMLGGVGSIPVNQGILTKLENIKAAGGQLIPLTGMSADALFGLARVDTEQGKAVRFALLHGLSFAVFGGGVDYSTWQEDLSLTDFSEAYWKKRAEMTATEMPCISNLTQRAA